MKQKYAGMTVNERLYASGFIDEFYQAVESGDTEKIAEILEKVELTEASIKPILDKIEQQKKGGGH